VDEGNRLESGSVMYTRLAFRLHIKDLRRLGTALRGKVCKCMGFESFDALEK
jgi:hypothetical protein